MNSDNSMRAAWFESCGSASESLKLGTQLKPDAGDEEVLVRIKSSGVNTFGREKARRRRRHTAR